MTIPTFSFALMTMASLATCNRKDLSRPADLSPPGPVRTVAEEPGVVPAGSSLVVQTDDAVTAVKAMRARFTPQMSRRMLWIKTERS